jgi:two-component system sensor histidine kinase CiaH
MLVYLGIIMAMSISFSTIIYFTTASQLERQLPGEAYIDDEGSFGPTPRVQRYIRESVSEGKRELVVRLYVLNIMVLLFGAAFSLMLARWTLEPIEKNVEAQTRFVSDASHELRTPLTAIQTTNEVALRRKKFTLSDAREVITSNLEDVKRLQRMTAMLLQLVSETQDLHLTPVSVRQIVDTSLATLQTKIADRKLTIDNQADERQVFADTESAIQALTILLDNAVKYSPEHETIIVRVTRPRRGYTGIAVVDRGQGIARDEQKKIFSRFYRTNEARSRRSAGGYGLGLEIAQKIAEAHGGSIELVSKLGKGSTFTIVLPCARNSRT